jgi:hypothetical protein
MEDGVTRPNRDLIVGVVFDEQWRLRPEAKKKCKRVRCDREQHTIAVVINTPFGWWAAWREPYEEDGSRWEYDWVDQVTGYTEASCNCRRRRRVDDLFARLGPVT